VTSSPLILSCEAVSKAYGALPLFTELSLGLRRGDRVGLIGPNGSGKSTLLKTIYGLLRPRRGSVTLSALDGRAVDLAGLGPNQITALGLNMVPQLANVFPDLSVRENLEIGARPIPRRFDSQLEAVLAFLPQLRAMLSKRAATLSGGQRQMLGLARALMSDPKVLILDEPSAGLAPRVQDEVFAKVRAISALGVSVLMVEQRARQCLAIADYGYVLEQGKNRIQGRAADLLADPEVIRLYLGIRAGTAVAPLLMS
jgi:ABC-type branched-subunit amino acid transport system ATPase component